MPEIAFVAPAKNLEKEIQLRKFSLLLYHKLWDSKKLPNEITQLPNWTVIKYLNGKGGQLNPQVNNIPADKGGLYIFFIKSPIVAGLTEFPMYAGRAQHTDSQNLRKRVKEYFNQYKSQTLTRAKIQRLFDYWRDFLYLAYLPMIDNDKIKLYEEILINSLNFPFNDKIPNTHISKAVKAFP